MVSLFASKTILMFTDPKLTVVLRDIRWPTHTTAPKLALDDQSQEQEQTSKTATSSSNPIQAIFGIEGDNPPAPDPTYWRKGYTFPVQLTNWAMAMAPHHPVAYQYIEDLKSAILGMGDLRSANPVSLSGPCAITRAVQTVALQDPGIIWDDLSGLYDPVGGRGKTIGPNRKFRYSIDMIRHR